MAKSLPHVVGQMAQLRNVARNPSMFSQFLGLANDSRLFRGVELEDGAGALETSISWPIPVLRWEIISIVRAIIHSALEENQLP